MGADKNPCMEIEVTPHMVEAGMSAWREWERGFDDRNEIDAEADFIVRRLIKKIFSAMMIVAHDTAKKNREIA